jgi:hypothetical protein
VKEEISVVVLPEDLLPGDTSCGHVVESARVFSAQRSRHPSRV